MGTIYDMVSNTRLRLGDPRAGRPGDFQLLNQVCSHVRTLLRHKRATGNPWNFNDLTVTVTPNQSTYQINQADFGTPLAVYSYDPNNPSWVARLIPFFQPQNMPYDWGFPQNMAAAWIPFDGSQCTAQRCAFYWRASQPFIEFEPLPLLQASYRVRYLQNAAGVSDMALTESPLPSEDCDLVEVRSALSLLPLTEWNAPEGEKRTYNSERRRDLMIALSAEEKELSRQFEAAALLTTGPRLNQRWNPTVG